MAGKWKLNPHKGNVKKKKNRDENQTEYLDREIIDSSSDKDSEEDMNGQYEL